MSDYPKLYQTAYDFPAIDNHAHPLLKADYRDHFPFENLFSEAEGDALLDSEHTLPCMQATSALGLALRLDDVSWSNVKAKRADINWLDLCHMWMRNTKIHCLLLDDGLGGVEDLAESYQWHDKFTSSPTLRIVRIEVVAEKILVSLLKDSPHDIPSIDVFTENLTASLTSSATDPHVAGFKSVACYRTGLDISTWGLPEGLKLSMFEVVKAFKADGKIRLAEKALNDHIVRVALEIAGKHNKPVQFHTGLGDNDITLTLSSPAHMQPIIKAFPQTKFVLLHSSYPFTRDAGYLTAVYANVFLDFGEIFPFVAAHGQRDIIRQILELCPTNKIMWSSDGHWWPESFWLGITQARSVLYEVLSEMVKARDLTESQAISIVENALFWNANRVYGLGLQPSH